MSAIYAMTLRRVGQDIKEVLRRSEQPTRQAEIVSEPAKPIVKATPAVPPPPPHRAKKVEKKDKSREFKLSGITQAGKDSTAIINDEVVRVGAKLGEWQVVQILPDAVSLSNGSETVSVTLNR